jgi:transcriptional regulator with XRE-family HTH domain
MPIDQDTLGAAIKEVRVTRGLTQSQLAKRLGFSTGGVALIEQGKRAVSMATLNAIANALELPPGCLAILGSRSGGKSKLLADFVESLKQAISTLINAQSKMAADGQKKGRKNRAIAAAAKPRNRRSSEAAQTVGTLAERPAKVKPARSGSPKVAAGR